MPIMRICIEFERAPTHNCPPPPLQAGEDALDRKRAAYLLQRALGPEELRGPAWSAWLNMYGLLEEFAAHLFKPAWGQVSTGSAWLSMHGLLLEKSAAHLLKPA